MSVHFPLLISQFYNLRFLEFASDLPVYIYCLYLQSYALHDINGEEIRATKWKLKISEGEEGYYRVSITVPKSLDEELDNNIVLRLFTSDNVNIKALVLRVQE